MKISNYIENFLNYCCFERERRANSVEKYKYVLKRIAALIGDVPVFEINQWTILDLKRKLLELGLSANYRSLIVSVFKNFLGYLNNFEKLDVYDYREIDIPRGERKPVNYLTAEEIESIIEELPEENISNLRFKALFCLLASSGARINEALNLKLSDVNFANREALVLGKGGRYRRIFFDERTLFYLNQYLATRIDG